MERKGPAIPLLVVTAVYTSNKTNPVIHVESATVMKGIGEVAGKVRAHDDTGMIGDEFSVSVDDAVYGFKSAQKMDCTTI